MSVDKTEQPNAVTTFTWTIENFEMCPEQTGEYITSPTFRTFSCPIRSFYLKLYAGGDEKENSKYFSLFLVKCRTGHENSEVYCVTFNIITRNRKKKTTKLIESFKDGEGWGRSKFIEREKVVSSEKQIFLPDGNLTLFCEISECKDPLNLEDPIQRKEISDAFVKLYESGKHSDATVKVKEKSFKIHKAVVEARFPDLLKNKAGKLFRPKNIDAKSFEALLQYVYSGYLDVSKVNIFELSASGYTIPNHLESLLLTSPQNIKAVTSFRKEDISFTWKIQNLKSLECDKSLRFYCKGESGTWTWFTVFLTVSTNKDNLIISIERYCKTCKKIICNIQISRVNTTFIHTFEENRWTLPNIPLKDIFTEDDLISSSEYYVNLNFIISVSNQAVSEEITINELYSYHISAQNHAEDLLSLCNDLKTILNNPEFSDIMLKCGEDKYPAHKCILSARSTFFADMLQNNSPRKDDELNVDLSSKVFKDFLVYLYCGDIRISINDINHVIEMYNAANKYNLPGLRRKCSDLLKQSLNADMAGEVLIAAYDSNDTEFRDFIFNFVCSNPEDIAKSKKWEVRMKERKDITSELFRKALSRLASRQK